MKRALKLFVTAAALAMAIGTFVLYPGYAAVVSFAVGYTAGWLNALIDQSAEEISNG